MNIINQDEGAAADIALYAKNTATLEEYVHRAINFNSTYLNKLQKWITKKKYTITVPPGGGPAAAQAPADGSEDSGT